MNSECIFSPNPRGAVRPGAWIAIFASKYYAPCRDLHDATHAQDRRLGAGAKNRQTTTRVTGGRRHAGNSGRHGPGGAPREILRIFLGAGGAGRRSRRRRSQSNGRKTNQKFSENFEFREKNSTIIVKAPICEPARCRSRDGAPLASLGAGRPTRATPPTRPPSRRNGDGARVGRRSRRRRPCASRRRAAFCATPAPIRPRTDAGDVSAAEPGPGIVRRVGARDGCYYALLRCRGRWVGVRVEATDHARRDLAVHVIIVGGISREGESTLRVETTKTRKRPTSTTTHEGAREGRKRASRHDPSAGTNPRGTCAKTTSHSTEGERRGGCVRREANDALPRRVARANRHSPDPEDAGSLNRGKRAG